MSKDKGIPQKLRDSVLLGLGAGMLTLLTWRDSTNWFLIGAALALLGVPTGIAGIKLYRGKTDTPPTPDSSSQSARASLPPHS